MANYGRKWEVGLIFQWRTVKYLGLYVMRAVIHLQILEQKKKYWNQMWENISNDKSQWSFYGYFIYYSLSFTVSLKIKEKKLETIDCPLKFQAVPTLYFYFKYSSSFQFSQVKQHFNAVKSAKIWLLDFQF